MTTKTKDRKVVEKLQNCDIFEGEIYQYRSDTIGIKIRCGTAHCYEIGCIKAHGYQLAFTSDDWLVFKHNWL